ncbi:putative transcription factor C3H family [Medicago truncatula]|uniref:Putative transcription factor C3H family n=1 Tax=Medicago truncatula TaxID=3880 RepID=G7IAA7_MEDTR|nr:zinc finger CCCH domain-containing protein 3 [Medicago truncatula]AES61488.1 U1 zinc finger protein [Medicago truncatula]AFK38615.1 unknown [Medicago truncatula]RHN80887.1 putative transcription factor C3H family [Medicago truncatula]
MAMKKYYCEYCDKQFQDTHLDRKRHSAGIQHKQAKSRWYDSFKPEHHNPIPPFCFHFVNTGFCRYGDSCKYFHPNTQQQQPITTTPGNIVGDTMGVSFGNLPPSLQPPPEVGYSNLPFLDWG